MVKQLPLKQTTPGSSPGGGTKRMEKSILKIFKFKSGFAPIAIFLIVCGIILFGIGVIYLGKTIMTRKNLEKEPPTTNQTTLPPSPIQTELSQEEPEANPQTLPSEEFSKDRLIEYPDVFIFYEYDDQIWKVNPKSEIKNKIANGISPSISPDKTKLAYVYGGGNKYFRPSEANLTGIHIFDIKTGKDMLLKHYDKDEPFGEVSWSPDGKYLVVDFGTDVVGSKVIIDTNTGREILNFVTFLDSYFWISNDEIVFNEMQEVSEPRPWGGGEGMGIAILNLNGQKKVLRKATDKEEYQLLQVLDDKIYFSLRTVDSPEDWEDENKHNITYWTMDKFGGNLTQVKEVESLDEKVKKLLPPPYNEYKFLYGTIPLSSNKDWIVFILNKKGESMSENEIFIMNVNNPSSIKKVADGESPTW